jgi:hypothetical protein
MVGMTHVNRTSLAAATIARLNLTRSAIGVYLRALIPPGIPSGMSGIYEGHHSHCYGAFFVSHGRAR